MILNKINIFLLFFSCCYSQDIYSPYLHKMQVNNCISQQIEQSYACNNPSIKEKFNWLSLLVYINYSKKLLTHDYYSQNLNEYFSNEEKYLLSELKKIRSKILCKDYKLALMQLNTLIHRIDKKELGHSLFYRVRDELLIKLIKAKNMMEDQYRFPKELSGLIADYLNIQYKCIYKLNKPIYSANWTEDSKKVAFFYELHGEIYVFDIGSGYSRTFYNFDLKRLPNGNIKGTFWDYNMFWRENFDENKLIEHDQGSYYSKCTYYNWCEYENSPYPQGQGMVKHYVYPMQLNEKLYSPNMNSYIINTNNGCEIWTKYVC